MHLSQYNYEVLYSNLCCCCYLGSYLVEIPKFVLVFLCLLVAWFVFLSGYLCIFNSNMITHNETKYDCISNRLSIDSMTNGHYSYLNY